MAASMPMIDFRTAQVASDNPEIRSLRMKKRELEEKIEQLKYQKPTMNTDEYMEQIETLLLELARTEQTLEKLQNAEN